MAHASWDDEPQYPQYDAYSPQWQPQYPPQRLPQYPPQRQPQYPPQWQLQYPPPFPAPPVAVPPDVFPRDVLTPAQASRRRLAVYGFGLATILWSIATDLVAHPRWAYWLPAALLAAVALLVLRAPAVQELLGLVVFSLVAMVVGDLFNTWYQRHLGFFGTPISFGSAGEVLAAVGVPGLGYALILLVRPPARHDLVSARARTMVFRAFVLAAAALTFARCFTGTAEFGPLHTRSYLVGVVEGRGYAPAVARAGMTPSAACPYILAAMTDPTLTASQFIAGCVAGLSR